MNLIEVYDKVISFLNKEKFEYIVIGGIAVGVLGELRATGDIDIDIILDKRDIEDFLNKVKKNGFEYSKNECVKRAKETGTFQIKLGDYHIDFIIASIELEKEAIKRKQIIKVLDVKSNLPTAEDLILLKIIAGRQKDIMDAKNIVIKNKGKLDKKYLIKWAQKISDEMESGRVYNEIKNLDL